MKMKPVNGLTPKDFLETPIWESVDDCEENAPYETYMRAVAEIPVVSLACRIVGVKLILSNGESLFGILGNVDLDNPIKTKHFLTITVFKHGKTFNLARYHDVDYDQNNEDALASFLELEVDSVFPIRYDISGVALGHSDCLSGSIPREPKLRFTEDDLIKLALE